MTTTSTERMRDLAERRRLGITYPLCKYCGAKCTSPKSMKERLCYNCWRDSPEGLEMGRANAKLSYDREKLLKRAGVFPMLQQGVEWILASRTLPPNGEQVLVQTIKGAHTLARLKEETWYDALNNAPIKVRYWTRLAANTEAHKGDD